MTFEKGKPSWSAGQNPVELLLSKKKAYLDGDYVGKHLQYRGWARDLLEHLLGNNCSECGIGSWYNEKPLTLQADHIDGDATNNQLGNMRLLCPNCHSQTLTYGSKNRGKSTRVSRRIQRSLGD